METKLNNPDNTPKKGVFERIKTNKHQEDFLENIEQSNKVIRSLNVNKRKAYFEENGHKEILAIAGMILAPIANIGFAHAGLVKLASSYSFSSVTTQLLAIGIPVFLEYAQFATLQPTMKKIIKKNVYKVKDVLDFVFFTLLIFVFSTLGLNAVADSQAVVLGEWQFPITIALATGFGALAIYSHASYQRFHENTVTELRNLAPDNVNVNELSLDDTILQYETALGGISKYGKKPVELDFNSVQAQRKEEWEKEEIRKAIVSEKEKADKKKEVTIVTGFGNSSQNSQSGKPASQSGIPTDSQNSQPENFYKKKYPDLFDELIKLDYKIDQIVSRADSLPLEAKYELSRETIRKVHVEAQALREKGGSDA